MAEDGGEQYPAGRSPNRSARRPAPVSPAPAAPERVFPPGKPGDFEFLAGNWNIRHRRLKNPTDTEWDVFQGEATCWSILGGVGSIEELRIHDRKFAGMGLRLLDVEKRVWSDFRVNGKSWKENWWMDWVRS